jgi:hypothetical protein
MYDSERGREGDAMEIRLSDDGRISLQQKKKKKKKVTECFLCVIFMLCDAKNMPMSV